MKQSQIIIDVGPQMKSVSLFEEGVLNEYYVEHQRNELITGNIYKGRVENVLDGLQTAFVDIGRAKKGFLYVGETMDGRSDLRQSGLIPQKLDVKVGDYVMVQVTKEETETKGARLTMNIALPGRFSVFMPTFDFIGISNKITDEKAREKLISMIEKLKAPQEGFIARTISTLCTKEQFLSEVNDLKNVYVGVKERYESVGETIAVIHTEGDLLFRTVRDMLRENVTAIVCNDYETTEKMIRFFESANSKCTSLVRYYDSKFDIIDEYGIADEVDKLLSKRVELVSGGSLIIEKTEALSVIDVNTARFRGVVDREETVFLNNCEAAKEIARQIRLRNIGGIIVIDFIDMINPEHKEEVVQILRKEVAADRIKTRVLDMTGLGLVEIARKKVGNELLQSLVTPCPMCQGVTTAHSPRWLCRKIKSKLSAIFATHNYENAFVSVTPMLQRYIFESKFFSQECSKMWQDKRIYIIPNGTIDKNMFFVTGSNASSLSLPNDAKLLY